MKNFVYIIIAVIGLTSCTGKQVIVTEGDIPEGIFYRDDEIKPYTGKAIVYYAGAEIVKEVLVYKEGILDGETTSYYRNGGIKRKGSYDRGKLTGKWECWYENGSKHFEVEYAADMLAGTYTSWHSSGAIQTKGAYANNSRTGIWVQYDESGKILKENRYEH